MIRSEPSAFLDRPRYLGLVGDEARAKRTWRLAFLLALAALGVSVGALAYLATQTRVESVVVLVDELGQAELVGPAARMAPVERERVVRAQLGLLIRNLRSVYPDPGAQAELLRRAYAFLAPEAAEWANAHFAEQDPRTLAKELAREVRIRSVLPVPDTDAWRVQWVEVETPHGAGASRALAWEAYLAVREQPPVSPQEATANPLGLRVTAINWTPVTQEKKP